MYKIGIAQKVDQPRLMLVLGGVFMGRAEAYQAQANFKRARLFYYFSIFFTFFFWQIRTKLSVKYIQVEL